MYCPVSFFYLPQIKNEAANKGERITHLGTSCDLPLLEVDVVDKKLSNCMIPLEVN